MLIPMSVLHIALNMDLVHIDMALKSTGYLAGADDMTSARFLGMNTEGKFVYEITFKDPDSPDGIGKGNIYVEIVYDKASCLFFYHADY